MDVVRFGSWVFSRGEQTLLRNGTVTPLQPKVMRLLEVLVEEAPGLVSHQTLIDAIWPDVVVAEANLKNLVSALRRTIDHDPGSSFIRTIHGRGYAFAPVMVESKRITGPRFLVCLRWGTRTISLHEGSHILGRQIDCEIHLDHSTISRRHAIIRVSESSTTIEDLESKNGTWVGADSITEEVPIYPGSLLRLGDVSLTLMPVEQTPTDTMIIPKATSNRERVSSTEI